jgi:transposase
MGQRRSFTEEFKTEAVRLVAEQGLSITQVSRDLGIEAGVLRRWRRKHDGLDPRPSSAASAKMPTAASPDPEELRRLRRENEQLRLEREILKKALGIFTERSR